MMTRKSKLWPILLAVGLMTAVAVRFLVYRFFGNQLKHSVGADFLVIFVSGTFAWLFTMFLVAAYSALAGTTFLGREQVHPKADAPVAESSGYQSLHAGSYGRYLVSGQIPIETAMRKATEEVSKESESHR